MAGDHKCPVCNSTFTRPQHVARHMRSHTGDRPYKCQHCGDQFARSDLLSRHVNKCHAAEKPPTTTAPNTRRKGTAAASRATTSKQACDQCVQSSLPCDGCNPCSKCVSRKCRCTYVKFHRQTAPAGPGHPPPNAISHHAHRAALVGPAGAYPEDLMYAPPPASSSLGGLYIPADYPLQPASSMYSHPYAPDPRDPALVMPRDPSTLDTSPEMMARYRAQADLLSRAGMLPNGALAAHALSATQGTAMPGMYASENQHLGRYDLSSSSAQAWAHPGHGHTFQDGGHAVGKVNHDGRPAPPACGVDGFAPGSERPFPGGGGNAALSAHPPTHGASLSNLSATGAAGPHGQGAAPGAYAGGGISFPQHHLQHPGHAPAGGGSYHRRSEELSDDFGSDHSVPSSANSSSVHLPIVDHRGRHYSASPQVPYQQPSGLGGSSSGTGGSAEGETGRKDEHGEGGFSNAFGLMSLDDPAVLAGLASDGTPFFSGLHNFVGNNDGSGASTHSANSSSTSLHSSGTAQSQDSSHTSHSSFNGSGGLSMTTPELLASFKGSLLSAGGRDAMDAKELKDFWKQYLRTPLTGPGSQTPMFMLQTPTGPGQQLGGGTTTTTSTTATNGATGRPSLSRRHSRVASLPSMKTPPLNSNQDFSTMGGGDFNLHLGQKAKDRADVVDNIHSQQQQQEHQQQQQQQQQQTQTYAPAYSSVRTTLHGDAEDLKSYEQAVLARKAPTQLKLVPRRRGTMPAGTTAPSLSKSMNSQLGMQLPSLSAITNTGMGNSHNHVMSSSSSAQHAYAATKIGGLLNPQEGQPHADGRPGSSSSSLADAFGSPVPPHQAPSLSHSQPSSESPRESSLGAESSDGGGGGSGGAGGGESTSSCRPSFKRLASQTLGPANSKRALLGPAGWDDEEALEEEEMEEERRGVGVSGLAMGMGVGNGLGRYVMGHGQASSTSGLRRFSLPASAGMGIASGGSVLPPIRTQVHESSSQSPSSAFSQ